MRDVTRDYLAQWTALKGELQNLKIQDVARYNTLLQEVAVLTVNFCYKSDN